MNKYIQDKLLEKHICRFNDGECKCDCYIAGMTDYHNHIVEKLHNQVEYMYKQDQWEFDTCVNFVNTFAENSLLQDTNPKE